MRSSVSRQQRRCSATRRQPDVNRLNLQICFKDGEILQCRRVVTRLFSRFLLTSRETFRAALSLIVRCLTGAVHDGTYAKTKTITRYQLGGGCCNTVCSPSLHSSSAGSTWSRSYIITTSPRRELTCIRGGGKVCSG